MEDLLPPRTVRADGFHEAIGVPDEWLGPCSEEGAEVGRWNRSWEFSRRGMRHGGPGRLSLAGGFSVDRIELLLPGSRRLEAELETVPTEEAEQSGVGQAVAGVIGGAAGASAGFGLGAATASLLIPGVGPVTAIGLAAAALFGAAGAAGGVAAGKALEDSTRSGIPRDELYLYEDALAHGKSVLFARPESEEQADWARGQLAAAGAESLDAARHAWWIGIRDAEKAHYESEAADFESVEDIYRRGFLAGLRPDLAGMSFDKARPALERQLGGGRLPPRGVPGGLRAGAERSELTRRAEGEPVPSVSRSHRGAVFGPFALPTKERAGPVGPARCRLSRAAMESGET